MLVNKEAFWRITCRLVCKLSIALKKKKENKKKKSLYDILEVIKMLQSNTHKAMTTTANHRSRAMQSSKKKTGFLKIEVANFFRSEL